MAKLMNTNISFISTRFWIILTGLLILVGVLTIRMAYLTIFNRAFLLHQGNIRTIRVINTPAYRGMISDRNGVPLAISTPVNSIWINPQDFIYTNKNIQQLSHLLNIPVKRIKQIVIKNKSFALRANPLPDGGSQGENRDSPPGSSCANSFRAGDKSKERVSHSAKLVKKREFVYLKRGVNPELAKSVENLNITGVYLEREYKRYYPESETAAQIIGFTNIDDQGQEGLELAYNQWLRGFPGKERVLKDLYGHVVAVLDDIQPAKSGNDLILSIDNRIQYLAYRCLKATVLKYHAKSGSVVVLNPKTGEILAMANRPSFNPNQRPSHDYGQFRNRAITDMFEPGSTMKAFSIASALDSGKYTADTVIDTGPGRLKIGHNIVHDDDWVNHGKLTVAQILQKSSNIGVAKMTLTLPPEHFLDLLHRVGFGERTSSNFPGESPGILTYHEQWQPFVLATLAFGYGISLTPLQLAQAYSIIADDGLKCPITFLKRDTPAQSTRSMDAKTANAMLHMLEQVVQPKGTGFRARINGYRVAGKTGTADIAGKHGYKKHRHHVASFVGIAPVTDPQLVVAVVIKDPNNAQNKYYGGTVAAPTFAKIMSGALRILNITPDAM
jgi:cell division protein FtsI (penicillin-binding protein 3)